MDLLKRSSPSKTEIKTEKVCKDAFRTTAASETELPAILVNGFQPLNIITKSPISDIATVLNTTPVLFTKPKV